MRARCAGEVNPYGVVAPVESGADETVASLRAPTRRRSYQRGVDRGLGVGAEQ